MKKKDAVVGDKSAGYGIPHLFFAPFLLAKFLDARTVCTAWYVVDIRLHVERPSTWNLRDDTLLRFLLASTKTGYYPTMKAELQIQPSNIDLGASTKQTDQFYQHHPSISESPVSCEVIESQEMTSTGTIRMADESEKWLQSPKKVAWLLKPGDFKQSANS
eukprot:scaffold6661_cov109-Cylindrotheca_fusiformis.AAC.5